jgi:DNA-binding transcriptional LysR family regulator
MDVELTELRYFYNVAEAKSFAEGARRSHVSPPAISKAIKKLESTLGTKLLERTSRRVTVTAAGELVLDYCRQVLGTLDELECALQSGEHSLRGELRIGTMEAFSGYALPQAIVRLIRQHPGIVPKIYRTGVAQMERLLLEGRLDMGLCFAPARDLRVDSHLLAESPASVVCGRGHPLYGRDRVTRDELAEHCFVATEDLHGDGRPGLELPGGPGLSVGATVDTLQLATQLVVDGAYLGYFPDVAIRCQLNHQELFRLQGLESGPVFEMRALTTSSRATVSALVELLQQTVLEALNLECAVPAAQVGE